MKHLKLYEDFLNEKKFKVGDKVTMKSGGGEMEITDSRRMFGSKINAYSVKKSDGETAEYDESQLKLAEDFVNEGTWSMGTAEAIAEMIDELESMLKLKDCKKILKALDKKFYDRAYVVLGDDDVHDYLAAIERECDGIGNLKAAHAEIENAIEGAKVLLKYRLS